VSANIEQTWWREFTSWGTYSVVKGGEPMADAVIFEPLPYRSALRDNCTDIIVLRTRADNVSVTVKMGLMEKMIMSRLDHHSLLLYLDLIIQNILYTI
jgi:hypothetical protein